MLAGETLSESYPAVPESVAKARNALTSFAEEAGADQEQLQAVRLAASEAVTNAVMHAYEQRDRGAVQVSASCVEGELWLLIADSGNGMRPRSSSPGLGLGLALIAQLADEFQILSRGSGGTELRLRFKLLTPARRTESLIDVHPDRRDQSRGSDRPRGSRSTVASAASSSFSTTR